ncbi:unnamed protein product [Penicillium glandicola]
MLVSRYEEIGQMNDLEEAIRVSRQAVAATPDDHPDLPILLNNLGNKLQSQYEQTGRMEKLDEAIRLSRQAVEVTPIGNPNLTGCLSTLGNMLESRYERTGQIGNLEEAIRVSRQAIEATPVDRPDLPIFLNNLENKLKIRYEQTGRMDSLGEVTGLSRQTSKATPDDLSPPPICTTETYPLHMKAPTALHQNIHENDLSPATGSPARVDPRQSIDTRQQLTQAPTRPERALERYTSREDCGRAAAAHRQNSDEEFYRMPPPPPPPMSKLKAKATPQIHQVRRSEPRKAQTSTAVPSQRRSSRGMDRGMDRNLDRFDMGDPEAELSVVSDQTYHRMSRETVLPERTDSPRSSHRRSMSYQDDRRGVQVTVASSRRRQSTTYYYNNEPSGNSGDILEDRKRAVENYLAAQSGRNSTARVPLSAEAMIPKATTNRQGSESGSQRSRSNSSRGSGTGAKTEEDKNMTLMVNGVKMEFNHETSEGQSINIRAGEARSALRLNIAGRRRPKQYHLTGSYPNYTRRTTQSRYGVQTGQINSIDGATRLSPQAVNSDHKATSSQMTHGISSQVTGDIILDKRPLGSDRDPGYASLSHTAASTVSSESAFPVNVELLPSGQPTIEHIFDHEIQTLVTDSDDIGSQKSDETTDEETTGKALLPVFLAEDPHFRTLCEKAILHMGETLFAKNMRRSLKSFYKNLSVEAETEAERAAAKLLRSRRGRQRISQQLAVYILQHKDENRNVDRLDLQTAPEDKDRMEAWLARNFERPVSLLEFEAQTPDIESSTSCSDSDSDVDEIPNISDLKLILRGTWSFQILLRDFMLLLLSPELKDVLLSIPRRHIWLSEAQDLSFMNRVKVWIEDKTETIWNWWPLESAKRPLRDGESRMFWICNKGAKIQPAKLARKHVSKKTRAGTSCTSINSSSKIYTIREYRVLIATEAGIFPQWGWPVKRGSFDSAASWKPCLRSANPNMCFEPSYAGSELDFIWHSRLEENSGTNPNIS